MERIFVLKRWRDLVSHEKNRALLIHFHATHRLLLLSHGPRNCRQLDNLAARVKDLPPNELYKQYEALLLEVLKHTATRTRHVAVLRRVTGYLRQDVTADEKKELAETIDRYATGLVPLIVPMTLINHYVRKYDQTYLKQQCYLNPHPLEMQMRNHV